MCTRLSFGILIAILGLCAPIHLVDAQDLTTAEVARWPLPLGMREGASVLEETKRGTFKTLYVGGNGLFCIADTPNDNRFSVECHPESLRAFLERKNVLAKTGSRAVRDSLLNHEVKSGQVLVPAGAHSHFISGKLNRNTNIPDSVWVWSEIAVPFAGSEETGLPTEDAGAQPWLMNAQAYGSHIMVGYVLIPWAELLKRE